MGRLVLPLAGPVKRVDTRLVAATNRDLLAQVSQGTHPEGTGASVLEHLLGDDATIPPDRGVFLDRTRRMHPCPW